MRQIRQEMDRVTSITLDIEIAEKASYEYARPEPRATTIRIFIRRASLSRGKRPAGGYPGEPLQLHCKRSLENLLKCSGEPVAGFLGAFFTLVLDVPGFIGSFLS